MNMISVFSQAKEMAFDALFNLLPINFSWVDTRGYILGCNQRLLDCLGINDINNIIGKHMLDFISDIVWENTKKVIETGNDIIIEEIYEDKEGNKNYFLSIKSAVKSKEGQVLGIVIIAIDITDRKLMEFELEESKKAAQLADKAKTEFLSNMRHDFRTPFSGIIGTAEILESKEKDPIKKQYLRDIIESSESLLNHLNEILDYVKIDSGSIEVTKKQFDIQEVLDDVYQMMLPTAKNKKLNLKFIIDKDIPRYLIGDISRLQRILMNLIANSIKFTEKGYIYLSVDCPEKEKSDKKCTLRFMIEDTGIGIPEEEKEAIFDKFYRISPSYNGIYNGSGLGLNIVKQFLEEIDGHYEMHSKVGEGTTFKIWIPYTIPSLENIVSSYVNETTYKKMAS